MVGPEKGRLASGKIGMGRMAEVDAIIAEAVRILRFKPRRRRTKA
jgi:phosphopantothenoylcysteine synthetase/decarboxylase